MSISKKHMMQLLGATCLAGIAAHVSPAQAQEAASASGAPAAAADAAADASQPGDQDIVVTARQRSERSLDVPTVITAFTGEQLTRAGVNSLTDIANLTPQLSAEASVGSFGGVLTLRGVTSPSANASSDAAIAINVDGVPLTTGPAVKLGQLDIGQVEILKGPQALFFGKNSSGGIIALKSAEPTRDFQSMVRIGYELKADEVNYEGMISGPLTDNLLGRVAVRYVDQQGFRYNDAPGVAHPRGPGTKDFAIRGSLTFEPSSALTVKLKAYYDKTSDDGSYFLAQRIFCPSGVPSGPAASPLITDCKADSHFARGDMLPNAGEASGNPLYGDGIPYSEVKQILGVLDVNYQLSDYLNLSSITGFYRMTQAQADSFSRGPIPLLNSAGSTKLTTWSQELRLASDESLPFNWMIGGFFQDDNFFNTEQTLAFAPPATFSPFGESFWTINSRTYSAFGQAAYNFTPTLSLSGGLRYTYEKKAQEQNLSTKFIPDIDFNNFSPEVTLSFKPTRDVHFYASYKQGYKSGNFQVSSRGFLAPIANPAITSVDNSYAAETVKGFEGGVKASLFDRSLRVEFAAYDYTYKDLQLSRNDPLQSINRISNAASSKVRGAEFSLNYTPAFAPSLTLNGAVSYNDASYKDFITACYLGQTIAQGCVIDGPDAGVVPDLQDLSGRPLARAPRWSGNFGFNYQQVFDGVKFSLGSQASVQSKSFLSQEDIPWGIRPNTFLVDANVSVGSENGSWELALIGKNLSNKYYGVAGFQEGQTGVASSTGTTVGMPADYSSIVNRGREVWIRLTLRPEMF